MNQGMLMESINLAAVWNLPVLFVCKDDGWAITTEPGSSTSGDMGERVRGLGVYYIEADGLDVEQAWRAAHQGINRVRAGKGPAFLHTRCVHFEGHFLGLLLLRLIRNPLKELPTVAGPLVKSFFRQGGGSLRERVAGVRVVLSAILATWRDPRRDAMNDPVERVRSVLMSNPERLEEIDSQIEAELAAVLAEALHGVIS
jgi:pyruvate dehydrogenase E1 component alpha subunit